MIKDIIYFSKLREDAIIPSKRDEDGAYDIYANFLEEEMIINPNEAKMIPTGIASAFSKDWRIVFQERGSTGSIGLKVNAGLIDSGFRGEWFVILNNCSNKSIHITKTVEKTTILLDKVLYPYIKAICQAKTQQVPKVGIKEIPYDELIKFTSDRGIGSLGSSGK